jgi:hypothetical protein
MQAGGGGIDAGNGPEPSGRYAACRVDHTPSYWSFRLPGSGNARYVSRRSINPQGGVLHRGVTGRRGDCDEVGRPMEQLRAVTFPGGGFFCCCSPKKGRRALEDLLRPVGCALSGFNLAKT